CSQQPPEMVQGLWWFWPYGTCTQTGRRRLCSAAALSWHRFIRLLGGCPGRQLFDCHTTLVLGNPVLGRRSTFRCYSIRLCRRTLSLSAGSAAKPERSAAQADQNDWQWSATECLDSLQEALRYRTGFRTLRRQRR